MLLMHLNSSQAAEGGGGEGGAASQEPVDGNQFHAPAVKEWKEGLKYPKC